MYTDVLCRKCKKEFEAEEFEDGSCPYCMWKYSWDEWLEYDDNGDVVDEYIGVIDYETGY